MPPEARIERHPEAFIAAAVQGPLTFHYHLTPQVQVQTTVTGPGRSVAAIQIINGTMPVWTASMNEASPDATLPYDLRLGGMSIKKGAQFHLTIPTDQQEGSVVMNAEVGSGPNEDHPFTALVAQWPLHSHQ